MIFDVFSWQIRIQPLRPSGEPFASALCFFWLPNDFRQKKKRTTNGCEPPTARDGFHRNEHARKPFVMHSHTQEGLCWPQPWRAISLG